jgi:IS5 family transposase
MERGSYSFSDISLNKRINNLDHVLFKIDRLIDWKPIDAILSITDYRNSKQAGRDCYSPQTMFRILLVQKFYCLSDRDIEEQMLANIVYIKFCGLSFDSPVPDHSTICRWRDRFIKFQVYDKIFTEFNRQLEKQGIEIRKGAIVDATLIESYSKPRKKVIIETEPVGDDAIAESDVSHEPSSSSNQCSESPQKITVQEVTSKDPDARWIKKGNKTVYGYKMHSSVNQDGFITAVITTPANEFDGNHFEDVIIKAKPEPNTPVYADKGYDSEKNRAILSSHKLIDKIMRKKRRNAPPDVILTNMNKAISKLRYVVERTFGGLKLKFRIGRSRYIGTEKTHNFNLLSSLEYNMIRIVKMVEQRSIKLQPI